MNNQNIIKLWAQKKKKRRDEKKKEDKKSDVALCEVTIFFVL